MCVCVCVCVIFLLYLSSGTTIDTDERNREGPTVTCDPVEDSKQVEKTVKQGSDNTGTQVL